MMMMMMAIGGAGGGSQPGGPSGAAGVRAEQGALASVTLPCLPGVPHALGTEHPSSRTGGVPAQPLSLLIQGHAERKPHHPERPSAPAPPPQHPQPHGHPKGSPVPGDCPRSALAVRDSAHPVPSHLRLPNFFFLGSN